jgi:hypothetical protein
MLSTVMPPQLDVVTATLKNTLTIYLVVSTRNPISHDIWFIFIFLLNTICDFDLLLYRSPYYLRPRLRSAIRQRYTSYTGPFLYIIMTCVRVCHHFMATYSVLNASVFLSMLSGLFAGCSIAARQLLYRLSSPICTRNAVSLLLYTVVYDVSWPS